MQRGGKPAVYAEDFRRDDGSNGKTVEDVYESLPCFNITPPLALVVKPVYYDKRVRTARLNRINNYETSPRVTLAHSWFPRKRKKFSGYLIL